jgi:hypothetical protein
MRALAVAMTLAGAKVLQFLQLPLYLLDFALPQPKVGQGSKQLQPPSLLLCQKGIECLRFSSWFNNSKKKNPSSITKAHIR